MPNSKKYLSKEEEQKVVKAIRQAEQDTSGEIRVHLENKVPSGDVSTRIQELFFQLEMQNTQQRNGVLIYVAMQSKTFYVLGDEGIHECVGDDFWNSTRDAIVSYFKRGAIAQGLVAGILMIGEELKSYFPYDRETDINELPDTISKG